MKDKNYEAIFKLEKNNWWYKSKRNLFEKILKKFNRNFERCLDIGCGVGSNFEILKNFSEEVVGIDYSDNALKYCKGKKYSNLIKMDATDMDFKENTFDLVICSDVLEHVNDSRTVKEILRVLKPNGVFIFSVPAHNYLWGPTDEISNHVKRYEKNELKSLFRDNFKILKLGYWNFSMFFPNLLFLQLLSIFKKRKQSKNTLDFAPKFLNKFFYTLLFIENKLFNKIDLPQGVSIVGICQKK